MKILFVNDDGYDSPGLHAVADLFKSEHEIAVVAPDKQKSGFSHSLTLKPNTIPYKKVEGYDFSVYSVAGTPVDCVKIGVKRLFESPDLVISGINRGENLGSDIFYSGTVSAALDAAHIGIKAFALSYDCDHHADIIDYSQCAKWFKANFKALFDVQLPRGVILNINFPRGEFKGVMLTRMNTQDTYVDVFRETGGELILDGHRDYSLLERDNDEFYCKNGYITITPLRTDRTDGELLASLKKVGFVV